MQPPRRDGSPPNPTAFFKQALQLATTRKNLYAEVVHKHSSIDIHCQNKVDSGQESQRGLRHKGGPDRAGRTLAVTKVQCEDEALRYVSVAVWSADLSAGCAHWDEPRLEEILKSYLPPG